MQQEYSWKKITMTVLGLLLTLAQVALMPNALSPDRAAATIAGMIVTLVVTIIGVVVQGKVDVAKLTAPGTIGAVAEQVIEQKITSMVMPELQRLGRLIVTVPLPPCDPSIAPPVASNVTTSPNTGT